MNCSALRLLAGPRIGALLAFLIAGVVLPSAARASCSAHYITARAQFAEATIDLDLLRSAGAIPGTDHRAPSRRPAPCSGAFCSGNPAPLPSPIVSISTTIGGQWAIPPAAVAPSDPGTSPFAADDTIRHPIEHSRSIFRPPPAPTVPVAS